ncbi:hypothetical protein JCM19045_3232 [Bacillus sp. JCM 19045]|nr:hypothetical protein JCM19045_3232 [Bacillus sp. JCM 19045]
MSPKKKEDMEKYKGLLIFNICIFYFCFVAGSVFLLINMNDLIKYNVSPGPIPLIIVGSLLGGIVFTYRYRKMYKK